jgi:hypothetical protein
MMKLKLLSCSLLMLSISGCFASAPTDSMIINHLKKKDPLAAYGCVNFDEFQRVNGFDRGNSYVVSYKIKQSMVLSQEACIEKITKSGQGDPFRSLNLIESMWNNIGVFVEFSMNEGKRTVQGNITFIKSEKGWAPEND